jgi:small subunit ribosomal protein S20
MGRTCFCFVSQHFVLGFREVPAGLIFSNQRTCGIPIASLMSTQMGAGRKRFSPYRSGCPQPLAVLHLSSSRLTKFAIRVTWLLFFIRSMANTRSAAKRARQTQVRMLRNRRVLTEIKSQQKKLRTAIGAGDEKQAALEFAALSSRLDKASRRGVIHKNLANRKKSRASRKLVAAKAPKAGAA